MPTSIAACTRSACALLRRTTKRGRRYGSFIQAADAGEIIFVRGATEAINLVAQTYGRANVGEGDEVLITAMEHHSNIVPWQMLCEEKGAHLRVAPINDAGELDLDAFEKLLTPRTRIVAVAHVSNALGTVNPVRKMFSLLTRTTCPCWWMARRPCRICRGRAGAGLRLLRVLRAQGLWSHRHRRAVREREKSSRRCPRTRVAAT